MAKRGGKVQSENVAVQTSNSVELETSEKVLPRRRKDGVREDLYNEYFKAYQAQFAAQNGMEK